VGGAGAGGNFDAGGADLPGELADSMTRWAVAEPDSALYREPDVAMLLAVLIAVVMLAGIFRRGGARDGDAAQADGGVV